MIFHVPLLFRTFNLWFLLIYFAKKMLVQKFRFHEENDFEGQHWNTLYPVIVLYTTGKNFLFNNSKNTTTITKPMVYIFIYHEPHQGFATLVRSAR